jgi:hypothetical protein
MPWHRAALNPALEVALPADAAAGDYEHDHALCEFLRGDGEWHSVTIRGWRKDVHGRQVVDVESQFQANVPSAGPATGYWNQGCQAEYLAVLAPLPRNSAVTSTGAFGAAPAVTIPGVHDFRLAHRFLLKRLEPVPLKQGNGVGRVQDLGFAAGRVRPGR